MKNSWTAENEKQMDEPLEQEKKKEKEDNCLNEKKEGDMKKNNEKKKKKIFLKNQEVGTQKEKQSDEELN